MQGSLISRYTITHEDGTPIAPGRRLLVLDLDAPDERERAALSAYILACELTGERELAASLRDALQGQIPYVGELPLPGPSPEERAQREAEAEGRYLEHGWHVDQERDFLRDAPVSPGEPLDWWNGSQWVGGTYLGISPEEREDDADPVSPPVARFIIQLAADPYTMTIDRGGMLFRRPTPEGGLPLVQVTRGGQTGYTLNGAMVDPGDRVELRSRGVWVPGWFEVDGESGAPLFVFLLKEPPAPPATGRLSLDLRTVRLRWPPPEPNQL